MEEHDTHFRDAGVTCTFDFWHALSLDVRPIAGHAPSKDPPCDTPILYHVDMDADNMEFFDQTDQDVLRCNCLSLALKADSD